MFPWYDTSHNLKSSQRGNTSFPLNLQLYSIRNNNYPRDPTASHPSGRKQRNHCISKPAAECCRAPLQEFHQNSGIPCGWPSPFEAKVAAMLSIIDFLRVGLSFSFVSLNGHDFADNSIIAQATIRWINSNQLPSSAMKEIEHIILEKQDVAMPMVGPVAPASRSSAQLGPRESNNNSFSDILMEDEPLPVTTSKRRRTDPFSISEPLPPILKRHQTEDTMGDTLDADGLPGHFPVNDDLRAELERIQKEVGHIPENDVHRGNLNSRFYTPLIGRRAVEYSNVIETKKCKTDDAKIAIALEILIEVARLGGRIRDVNNLTPLENRAALKKVMDALKDKAREMKKRGVTPSSEDAAYRGETICLDRRTRENVEMLKMLRRSSGSLTDDQSHFSNHE